MQRSRHSSDAGVLPPFHRAVLSRSFFICWLTRAIPDFSSSILLTTISARLLLGNTVQSCACNFCSPSHRCGHGISKHKHTVDSACCCDKRSNSIFHSCFTYSALCKACFASFLQLNHLDPHFRCRMAEYVIVPSSIDNSLYLGLTCKHSACLQIIARSCY